MGEWSVATYRDVYERKYAPHWDKGGGHSPPVARHFAAASLVRRLRGVREVLDVGCGPGQVVRLLAASGYRVRACEVVSTLFERQLSGFDVVLGGLPSLPFQDVSCDAALAVDVLEHLDEDEIAPSVDDLARVTRKFLLTEVSSSPWYWTLADGSKVDVHRTLKPWSWWRERIGRRFVEVAEEGGVVAWIKREAVAGG